jgi:hypothetical protein
MQEDKLEILGYKVSKKNGRQLQQLNIEIDHDFGEGKGEYLR